MKSNKYILPNPSGSRTHEASDTPQSERLKRRRSTFVACNTCRVRKTGCDGNRPSCTRCMRRGTPCTYVSAGLEETPAMAIRREIETLKQEKSKLQELLNMLRTLPELRSLYLLQKLRLTTVDLNSLLSQDSSSFDEALPRLAVGKLPTQGSIEFQLMIRHAFAYPTLSPLDASALGLTSSLASHLTASAASKILQVNILFKTYYYIPDLIFGLTILSLSQKRNRISPQDPVFLIPEPSTLGAHPLEGSSPSSSERYYDSRLSLLNIRFWSRIKITNDLAATLLSLYLETDHITLGFFNYDLFLTDLVDQRVRYCSELLVSSILSWACLAYCNFDAEIVSIGDELFDEPDNLWHLDQPSDSLPTIAAAQLLALRSMYNGSGDGYSYQKLGIGMAQRMGLFGLANYNIPIEYIEDPESWEKASARTAWGAFNLAAMRSFMFQEGEPALLFPPNASPPGSDGSSQRGEPLWEDDSNRHAHADSSLAFSTV
ncbi:Zn(2)-C6 fungal-type DNA-binding domain protein [Metarhizium robertsii ARSEF 23]|uniref:Zn(2)-C6 fungal-type DNA-binding domain protein n=1 Tax=Metarhizium robertsii (strain ARSEF 23 / ATCC MYA-3075) TaxID=655844 RepID=E9F1R0_METRA|nr:Zn(2)-C6 fungal-type DNA-binding domain protein [Metarhizium robertsii ARSEF 23]EFY97999.1 Zn(2)-C6 fungal-type DNA-binding domain protein [Metarhizium robertsii ARSEF 23]